MAVTSGDKVLYYLLVLLKARAGDKAHPDHPIDKLRHSLQSATLAKQAGLDSYWVVGALFHDVLGGLIPGSHGSSIANVLEPFMPDEVMDALAEHDWAMTDHWEKTDKVLRAAFRGYVDGNDYLTNAVWFARNFDAPAFDPEMKEYGLEAFTDDLMKVFGVSYDSCTRLLDHYRKA